ncbi:MAG: SGNH/GDSL hydrolase family protein [Clostridiales bacterium]|nr:SGNH/GDSL hydrolase family protein [Clostridiales bacterium]
MHRLQYAVSYKHGDSWLGPIPRAAEEKLPKFRAKIRAGEQVRVAFTGDSITTGANSSAVVNAPPFLPMWPDMVTDFIDDNYPSKEGKTVNINRSLGGVCSDWGAFTARESFGKESPDLCVIAYGMNDASGRYTSLFVKENYRKIAEILLDINPDCEFIFVSTTLPNPIAAGFTTGLHFEHEALLAELTGEMGDIAALAPVTNMHRYLLTRKRFADMTGNNINHPNDWLARVYAQVICTVMI